MTVLWFVAFNSAVLPITQYEGSGPIGTAFVSNFMPRRKCLVSSIVTIWKRNANAEGLLGADLEGPM